MKYLTTFIVTATLMFGICETNAQDATEVFIPVGQSPGVSGVYSIIAKIDDVNSEDNSLNMSNSSSSFAVKLMEQTKIWLDKSKLKMTNKAGNFSDLKSDLTIEVRYIDKEHKGEIEWVKVQLGNTGE